jgi:PAS domain S-box-containing protein
MKSKLLHILLVEDSEIHAELIRDALAAWGAQVRLSVASSLKEARGFLAQATPDLALIDLMLPDGRGTELLPADREQATFPAVLLTASGDEKTAVEAMKAGALDYLVKCGATLADLPYIIERTLSLWGHIVRRRQAEAALRLSEAKYRGLFEHMRDAVAIDRIVYDQQGRPVDWLVTDVNPAYEEIFGIPREQAIGRRGSALYGAVVDLASTLEVHADVAETGVPRQFELSFPATNKHLLISVFSLGEGEYATLSRDITERKRIEAEREHFLHTITHDLRIPLTVIQGYAQLLQEAMTRAGGDDDTRLIGDELMKGVRRMGRMVDELVETARLEGGQIALQTMSVDLRSFVAGLAARAEGVLEPQRLVIEIPDDLPAVAADPDRLDRILLNLLTNAQKYSPPQSPIRLQVRAAADAVEIAVVDRGVGIAPEDQPQLFERFCRPKGARRADSVGLGLYITRMLVEAHGGRIRVESAPGAGSTFYFTLPLA